MKKTLSAYERKMIIDTFEDTITFYEIFIERKNIPNWQAQMKRYWKGWEKRWQADTPEKIKSVTMVNLFGFRIMLRQNKEKEGLPETKEELKQEFYKWIDGTKINVDNCPLEFKDMLFDFHEVLEGRGEKFAKRLREENKKELAKWSAEKWQEEMSKIGTVFEEYEKLEKEKVNFEGKNWNEINLVSKFNGNAEKGKQTFQQIIQEKPESSKEQKPKKESNNHSKENSNFSVADKEFPWKTALLVSLPIVLAIVVIVIIITKKDKKWYNN